MNFYNFLYNKFPRQIAFPYRKTVDNKTEFYKMINKYNGIKRIFASVYNYTGNSNFDLLNLDVDKIFFDIDGESKSLEEAKKLADYLLKKNYRFTIIFSGGGFHFYVFTKNYDNLSNKKLALFKSHLFFKNKLDINIDNKTIGDLARVATVPNTWNTKRQRFAIPVMIEDLDSYQKIKEKAKKQCFEFKIYGKKLFNIRNFDNGVKDVEFCINEIDDKTKLKIDEDKLLRNLPPCISGLLANGNRIRVGWRGRFLIIVYLRDKGLLPGNIKEIINKYLTTVKNGKTEAYHCLFEEKQVNYLFKRDDNMFPFCENVKREGYCPVEGFCKFSKFRGDVHLVDIYR